MKCLKCKKIDKIVVGKTIHSQSIKLDTVYLEVDIYCMRCLVQIHGYNFVDNVKPTSKITHSEIKICHHQQFCKDNHEYVPCCQKGCIWGDCETCGICYNPLFDCEGLPDE